MQLDGLSSALSVWSAKVLVVCCFPLLPGSLGLAWGRQPALGERAWAEQAPQAHLIVTGTPPRPPASGQPPQAARRGLEAPSPAQPCR